MVLRKYHNGARFQVPIRVRSCIITLLILGLHIINTFMIAPNSIYAFKGFPQFIRTIDQTVTGGCHRMLNARGIFTHGTYGH